MVEHKIYKNIDFAQIAMFAVSRRFYHVKDRQQVITAVLPQWQLNALCEFALHLLCFYHMS